MLKSTFLNLLDHTNTRTCWNDQYIVSHNDQHIVSHNDQYILELSSIIDDLRCKRNHSDVIAIIINENNIINNGLNYLVKHDNTS